MRKLLWSLMFCSIITLTVFAQSSFQKAMINGKKVYQKNCLTCHQANGGGVPKINPPLIDAEFVKGDKGKLIQWVLKGSVQKVAIDGKYYSNNMPPQATLKDQDIADVLTYIRNSFKNKASLITADEVKAERGTK